MGPVRHEAGRHAGAGLVPRREIRLSDPVSWLLIERGWTVAGSDGSEIGRVVDVVGDKGKDIFDGLSISSRVLGRSRYVAAERVRSIEEGRVHVDVDDPSQLPEYEEPPPSERIIPAEPSWWDRLRGGFRRP